MSKTREQRFREEEKFYLENPDQLDGTCPFSEVPVESTDPCLTWEACETCLWWKKYCERMEKE